MQKLLTLAVGLLVAGTAHAQVARYGEQTAVANPDPLCVQAEEVLVKAAAAAHQKVTRSGPLARAMSELVLHLHGDAPPNYRAVQAALWKNGLVEPSPRLIVFSLSVGGESQALQELAKQAHDLYAETTYRRVGVGVIRGGENVALLIALEESQLDLQPIVRELPAGGSANVSGHIAKGFGRAQIFVTSPDGRVQPLVVTPRGASDFTATFACGPQKGPYQTEIVADGARGATVLANFPLYCGVTAAAYEQFKPDAAEPQITDVPSAERALLALMNEDRRRAGVAPLVPDSSLSDVARAHSNDMLAHNFVGHVSPTHGKTTDRLKAAHVRMALSLENVGRAYSLVEVEEGFMDSPGHRSNLLNAEVTRAGVGIAIGRDAKGEIIELLVTQLFARPFEAVDATTGDKIFAALAAASLAQKRTLARDPGLDQLAQAAAERWAKGAQRERVQADVDAKLNELAHRYAAVGTSFTLASQLADALPGEKKSVLEAGIGQVGIGVAADAEQLMNIVIIFARPR
jgi:uncharacterized protein YkwD